MWGTVRHGEKQEEQSSQNMLLHYGVVQILQAVAPDFLNIMCHVSKNYFMNNFGLSKCSEIRTCLTKECQKKRKSCEVRCGVETQCEVRLGGSYESHWTSISAKGNLHCPLYSEKEGLCRVETYLYNWYRFEDKGIWSLLC